MRRLFSKRKGSTKRVRLRGSWNQQVDYTVCFELSVESNKHEGSMKMGFFVKSQSINNENPFSVWDAARLLVLNRVHRLPILQCELGDVLAGNERQNRYSNRLNGQDLLCGSSHPPPTRSNYDESSSFFHIHRRNSCNVMKQILQYCIPTVSHLFAALLFLEGGTQLRCNQ